MAKEKKLTKAKKNKLLNEIIEFLMKKEMFESVSIYADNKRYCLKKTEEKNKIVNSYGSYYFENDIDVKKMLEYCNADTISMSFEGAFYDVINGYSDYDYKIQQQFNEIIKKYDLYYEQGHAWDLALYFD